MNLKYQESMRFTNTRYNNPIHEGGVFMATLLFGDSIAKGITYDDSKLSIAVEGVVDKIEKRFKIEVLNYSIYGQTIKRLHEKNIIQSRIEKLDYSIQNYCAIALGGNDADFDWEKVSTNPLINHEPKTPLKQFEELLEYYVKYLQSKKITVILLTTVPLISKRYFNEVIQRVGNPKHIMEFFNQDIEMISRHHEAYSHVITKIAYKYQCILLDIRTHLLLHNRYNDYLSLDGVHPNQLGYDLIFDIIDEMITKDDRLKILNNHIRYPLD